ncbi:MAG: hypothetical protein ACK2TU_05925, partial [Anaerolineales bacterium]
RSINREKFKYSRLIEELSNQDSRQKIILNKYIKLLKVRSKRVAFHPKSSQRIIEIDSNVFCLLRGEETNEPILCLINVASIRKLLSLNLLELKLPKINEAKELLSLEKIYLRNNLLNVQLDPYQVKWFSIAD